MSLVSTTQISISTTNSSSSDTASVAALELSACNESSDLDMTAAATAAAAAATESSGQQTPSPQGEDNGDDDDDEEAGSTVGTGIWTKEEHARFLEAIKIYANGPWKLVAAYVATRTVRQTMTHAQKYRQKAARRLRGLRTKQALMRMHYGHRISEESLVQERLRALTAQVESASTAPQPLYTPTAASTTAATSRRAAGSATRKHQRTGAKTLAASAAAAAPSDSLLALLTDSAPMQPPTKRRRKSVADAVAPIEPFGAASPCAADGIGASSNILDLAADLEIIDDLSEAPSLEECAEMLYDLLCC